MRKLILFLFILGFSFTSNSEELSVKIDTAFVSVYNPHHVFAVLEISNNSEQTVFIDKSEFDQQLTFVMVNNPAFITATINIRNSNLRIKPDTELVLKNMSTDDITSDSFQIQYLMERNFLAANTPYLKCPPNIGDLRPEPLVLAPKLYYTLCPHSTNKINVILVIDYSQYPKLEKDQKAEILRSDVDFMFVLLYSYERGGSNKYIKIVKENPVFLKDYILRRLAK